MSPPVELLTKPMWRHGRRAWQLATPCLYRNDKAEVVQRNRVGNYEMRYELVDLTVYILRVWHTREER